MNNETQIRAERDLTENIERLVKSQIARFDKLNRSGLIAIGFTSEPALLNTSDIYPRIDMFVFRETQLEMGAMGWYFFDNPYILEESYLSLSDGSPKRKKVELITDNILRVTKHFELKPTASRWSDAFRLGYYQKYTPTGNILYDIKRSEYGEHEQWSNTDVIPVYSDNKDYQKIREALSIDTK